MGRSRLVTRVWIARRSISGWRREKKRDTHPHLNSPSPGDPPVATGKERHMASITERERQQVEQANASGKIPVVFIHGLWVLPSS